MGKTKQARIEGISGNTTRLMIRCEGCGVEVPPTKGEVPGGVVHVLMSEVYKVQRLRQEWDKAHEIRGPDGEVWGHSSSGADLVENYPEAAHWAVHCMGCNPHADAGCEDCYWFDVDSARTWSKLVDWTAHLMTKNWLGYTDWRRLLDQASKADNDS
jgi:hypothetical protein